MASLADLLSQAIEDRGWAKTLRLQAAVALWDQVVGPAMAGHSRALEVTGDTLLVKISGSSWRSEIAFEKDRILAEINKKIAPEKLKDIRFLA